MKKIIRYSALCLAGALLCAGTLASCVDPFNVGDASLEKSPGVDVDITTIFSKGENAEYFLWNLYNNMRNPLTRAARMNQTPAEALADTYHDYCGWGGSGPYYNGSIQPGDGNDKFPFVSDGGENRGIWEAIRAGWIIIENIDSVPDRSAEQKSHIKGEAYLIMATRYFDCLRNYGGLPLVDHVFSASETFEGGRATVEETVDFIDGLIQKSIDESGFRWRWEDQDTWAGRLSKSGAYALRAKLWLFAASPLFNAAEPYMDYGANVADANPLHVWYGGYRADLWQRVLPVEYREWRLVRASSADGQFTGRDRGERISQRLPRGLLAPRQQRKGHSRSHLGPDRTVGLG